MSVHHLYFVWFSVYWGKTCDNLGSIGCLNLEKIEIVLKCVCFGFFSFFFSFCVCVFLACKHFSEVSLLQPKLKQGLLIKLFLFFSNLTAFQTKCFNGSLILIGRWTSLYYINQEAFRQIRRKHNWRKPILYFTMFHWNFEVYLLVDASQKPPWLVLRVLKKFLNVNWLMLLHLFR